MRVKTVKPQHGLNFRERFENQKDSLDCRGDVSGETIVVLDDVSTSGGSLIEAARALREKGATVFAIVLGINKSREEYTELGAGQKLSEVV